MAPDEVVSVIVPVAGSIQETLTSVTLPPTTTPTEAMIRSPSGVQLASPGRRIVFL